MADFAEFAPDAHGCAVPGLVIRPGRPEDADALARVMATHAARASRLLAACPVLLLAVPAGAAGAVGWSGAVRTAIMPGLDDAWLVSGLTVMPEHRRRSVGERLLRAVVEEVAARDPRATLHSVVNARNLASIALHENLGFTAIAEGSRFAGITFDDGRGSGILLGRTPGG